VAVIIGTSQEVERSMATRITAHVQPKARTREIALRDDGSLTVKVTVAAEEGKANEAVCDLLGERLGIAKRDVRLVSGHRNRNKVLEVALEREDLLTRLAGSSDSLQ
jgi:hypothetical protein